jgi:hypothetical protein
MNPTYLGATEHFTQQFVSGIASKRICGISVPHLQQVFMIDNSYKFYLKQELPHPCASGVP